MKVEAPWSDEQVYALNRWQGCDWVHEFTCPAGHMLAALHSGWVCPDCNYRQTWAHDYMYNPLPPDPLELLKP